MKVQKTTRLVLNAHEIDELYRILGDAATRTDPHLNSHAAEAFLNNLDQAHTLADVE